nr:hypothetical protein Q903MT_gene4650 [Picea sitchensis]
MLSKDKSHLIGPMIIILSNSIPLLSIGNEPDLVTSFSIGNEFNTDGLASIASCLLGMAG